MKSKYTALLVSTKNEPFETVKIVLEGLSVAPIQARNRPEVASGLRRIPPPHLVVTVPEFVDGHWWDVLELAAQSSEKVNVIVVSPVVNVEFYMEVMSRGGFDFMTDGFTVPELVHVLRGALEDATRSRQAPKQAGSAIQNEPTGQLAL